MILGADYAKIDGNSRPNFTAARAARIGFTYARASVGTSPDPTFLRDRDAARAAGIFPGAYMAIDWNADADAQVRAFTTSRGTPRTGELPPAIDVEGAGGHQAEDVLKKIEAIVSAMRKIFGQVVIYTSDNVWHEQIRDLPSKICGSCPLWEKVSYPWNRLNPPHPESIPPIRQVPAPWRSPANSPWIEQFQGDAIAVRGFSSTVDLNLFLLATGDPADPRNPWIDEQMRRHRVPDRGTTRDRIGAFQAMQGLQVDQIVGPATFSALCALER